MHTGMLDTPKWAAAEGRARLVAQQIETRLNLPARHLLADTDLLVRRFVQRGKEFRIKFANAGDSVPKWKSAILSIVEAFERLRYGVINLTRGLAGYIEGLSARGYQARVRGDLAGILPAGPELVLAGNNPEKSYIAPLLSQLSPSFSAERYVSLLRHRSAIVLERGEHIPDASKEIVILEIDSYRKQDVDPYLEECGRILRHKGLLIVSLHQLSFRRPSGDLPISAEQIVEKLGAEFKFISIKRQGGLGSYGRVKVATWLRGAVSRHVSVRWALLVFGVPLLPLIAVLGGIFIVVTAALDLLDGSTKFSISSLILAEKDQARV